MNHKNVKNTKNLYTTTTTTDTSTFQHGIRGSFIKRSSISLAPTIDSEDTALIGLDQAAEEMSASKRKELIQAIKEAFDQETTEIKYRVIHRKEVHLDDKLYDIRCSHQTRKILKRLEDFLRNHMIVLNDCYYTKHIWEKIKQMQIDKDERADELRRFQAILYDRAMKLQFPALAKVNRPVKLQKNEQAKLEFPKPFKLEPIKRIDLEGKAWSNTSSARKANRIVSGREADTYFSQLDDASHMDEIYNKADTLVHNGMFSDMVSQPLLSKKTEPETVLVDCLPSFEIKKTVSLPEIEKQSSSKRKISKKSIDYSK